MRAEKAEGQGPERIFSEGRALSRSVGARTNMPEREKLERVKKGWNRKPGSVLLCHLSSQPTPWHRTGRPHLPVYLVLQARMPYPPDVTVRRRGLLPRVFTLAGGSDSGRSLLHPMDRRLFSVTASENYSPLRFPQSGALPCPDFPHRLMRRDRPFHPYVDQDRKGTHYLPKLKTPA